MSTAKRLFQKRCGSDVGDETLATAREADRSLHMSPVLRNVRAWWINSGGKRRKGSLS